MTLGQLLVERRRKLRITQEKVAPLLGVSLRTYQSWEAGTFRPQTARWKSLAKHLEIGESDVGAAIGRAMEVKGEH